MRSSSRIRLRSGGDPSASAALPWTPLVIAGGGDAADAPVGLPDEDDLAGEADGAREIALAERIEEIEAALREEFDARLAEAYAQGVEDGRRAGAEEADAQLRSAREGALAAAAEIRARESEWAGILEENVCALAIAVARQIIDRELQTDRLIVLELARSAAAQFGLDEALRIRVHPDDHAHLAQEQGGAAELAKALEGRAVQWVADAGITAGGCVVEGRERIVDGRVDTALVRAYRTLTGQPHA